MKDSAWHPAAALAAMPIGLMLGVTANMQNGMNHHMHGQAALLQHAGYGIDDETAYRR